ncbi:MAG: hypothetical protein IPK87_14110 [Planctomycetes bacterium]|nr:hypothetical protein [Planctomycetota bacterium]
MATVTVMDEPEHFSFPVLAKLASVGMMVLGLIAFGLTWIGGVELAMTGWVIAAWYCLGFPLFATLFISISHLSSSGWHVVIKRVPEAMTRYLPVAAGTFVLIALAALFSDFYDWAHPVDHGDLHSELIAGKTAWLNPSSFVIRMAIYFGVWIAASWALVRASRKQDVDGDVKHTTTGRRVAAPYAALFATTVTFASIDYIMSVEPTWFSTMFGVYQFAGIMESGFAMLALLLIFLQQTGYLRKSVNENHYHNVGIWLLASATFWAYIWFCQFMLIWYSNIPEETQHYLARWEGPWFWVSFGLNPLINWVIPFLILLPRPNKRNPKMLAIAAFFALGGRFIDLWQLVAPRSHPVDGIPHASAGVWTVVVVGTLVGVLGLFLFVTLKALEKAPLLAKKDPYYVESVHHHL